LAERLSGSRSRGDPRKVAVQPIDKDPLPGRDLAYEVLADASPSLNGSNPVKPIWPAACTEDDADAFIEYE
jgi:hypothetical protein